MRYLVSGVLSQHGRASRVCDLTWMFSTSFTATEGHWKSNSSIMVMSKRRRRAGGKEPKTEREETGSRFARGGRRDDLQFAALRRRPKFAIACGRGRVVESQREGPD